MNRVDFLLRSGEAAEQRALFPVGETIVTRSALERLDTLGVKPFHLIARHQTGDWGDVDDADRTMNEESLHERQRFFSAYEIERERVWVLTTADLSRTIVFLPGRSPDGPAADPPAAGWR